MYHESVMLNETIKMLNIKKSGIYIDATLGGGGHSEQILKNLGTNGKLISLDMDEDAICYCKDKFFHNKRIQIFNSNFIFLDKILENLGIKSVDGICIDLGVSSHQIDCPEKGFSYIHNAPLDMRMGKNGKSAYDIVNFTNESDLANIIFKYGEERFAKLIAKSVCKSRKIKKIKTTFDLVKCIEDVVPKYKSGHSSKRTFQAIRIAVNNELNNLEIVLDKCLNLLSPQGRLAILTFHSLEDRIVKQRMQFWEKICICPSKSPICTCNKKKEVVIINKKVITSSTEEIARNPRCKSAKLRVCEKI